jgi:hypothetical protein
LEQYFVAFGNQRGSDMDIQETVAKTASFAFKVPGHPVVIEWLCRTTLIKSSCGAMAYFLNLLREKNADLWCVVDRGFCLLGTRYRNIDVQGEAGVVQRELVVYGMEGIKLYNPDGIEMLIKLSKQEGCDSIFATTQKEGVKRLMMNIGFFVEFAANGTFEMRLPHGR